jgi:hypothetical protein
MLEDDEYERIKKEIVGAPYVLVELPMSCQFSGGVLGRCRGAVCLEDG